MVVVAEAICECKERLLMLFDKHLESTQIAVFVSQHQYFIRRGFVHTLSLISNVRKCQKIHVPRTSRPLSSYRGRPVRKERARCPRYNSSADGTSALQANCN